MYRVEIHTEDKNFGTFVDTVETLDQVRSFAGEKIEDIKSYGRKKAIVKIYDTNKAVVGGEPHKTIIKNVA